MLCNSMPVYWHCLPEPILNAFCRVPEPVEPPTNLQFHATVADTTHEEDK